MVVKAAPSTPFMVTEPKFLLELRVVAPDAPPPPGLPAKIGERGAGRQNEDPSSWPCILALWPLDQVPFFGARLGGVDVAMSGTDPHGSEGGRPPRLFHGPAGSGAMPGGHGVVADWMPITWRSPGAVMRSRKPVSTP
jgi:hypothetical protein